MKFKFTGKTALVTGGNKGIGFAICQGLLSLGFDVILGARSLARGKAAAEKLRSTSPVRVVQLDVADDDSIQQATKELSEQIDCLDVLVNNAGLYPDRHANIITISRETLNLAANVNAFGLLLVTQAFLPLLEKAATARVINVLSKYSDLRSLSGSLPSYSLSKLTLNGATIMLADALKPKGIAVYAMCPGWVKTDMGGLSAPRSPEQGADTAIWLATEAALNLSGKFFRDRARGFLLTRLTQIVLSDPRCRGDSRIAPTRYSVLA